MKTKSPSVGNSPKIVSKVSRFFNTKKFNTLAKKSGYRKRSSGKISAKNLALGFMMMVTKKKNTYESWSQEISLLTGSVISRQAIENRMRPETTALLKSALEQELVGSMQTGAAGHALIKFNHLKLEDSTVVNLPEELSFAFPGNVSKGKKKSQAKIHALYDFTSNSFDFMNIHSFTRNDQSLSKDSLPHIAKGDLLLRDMGFLVLDALDKIGGKQAYFISPKAYKIKIYNTASKEEISLPRALAKNPFMDKEVLVGKEHKKMRLVILPLPPKLAAQRVRKASHDRDRRLNHSNGYYYLLGYSIFLTNIPQEVCSAKEIAKLYGLRWQIEIVFKSWKSGFHLEKLTPIKCNNPERVYCMIYLWLIFIWLFHTLWINQEQIYISKGSNLSILKLAKFFSDYFHLILTGQNERLIKQLMYRKCQYDKRNDRTNLMQKYEKIAA